MTPVLEALEVRRRYGDTRGLTGVSLRIDPGEIYVLLGPNGAGKTSLVRAVSGRLRLDGGSVRIAGTDPRSAPGRRALGLVPQEVALYPDLSAAENLFILGQLAGMERGAARAAVVPALEWIDLLERGGTPVEQLSGGQRRRVNVAAGTLHAPALLVLDEPTVGVDLPARERIHRMLRELRGRGMGMLLATHDLEQAAEVADRVGIIVDGAIRAEGTIAALIARHYAAGDQDLVLTLGRVPEEAVTGALRSAGLAPCDDPLMWVGAVGGVEHLAPLLATLSSAGAAVRDARVRDPGLPGVFLRVAGRELAR